MTAPIIKKIYERGKYEDFARYTIERFKQNMRLIDSRKGKGGKGLNDSKLMQGLKYRLVYGGDRRVSKIVFEYPAHGLFVDMGVGRSLNLDDIGYQKIGRTLLGRKVKDRRARRWYLKTIYGRTIALMGMVAKERGDEFGVTVAHYMDELKRIDLDI
jgi:hypothetical protein